MLVHTQIKHDIVCWTITIGLHLLLFLVNFNLYKAGEAGKFIPIVEVEYVIPEEIIAARQVGTPPKTFKEKLKHFFKMKEVVPPKKEELAAGKGSSKLEVEKIEGLSPQETLIDKKGTLSRKVDLSAINKSKEKLIAKSKEEQIVLVSKGVSVKGLKSEGLKDKDKEYRVAKKDLPFQVATREEIRGSDMDIVAIDLGKKTSKSVVAQAPILKDMERKGEFGEGAFRVVQKEAKGKLSGTEVLADLLAMAKIGGAGGSGGEGSSLGSGGALTGEGTGSKVGFGKQGESEEKGFVKGVVFSRVPAKEGGSRGAGSGSEASKEVAKKEQRGRVIFEITGPLSRRRVLYREIPSYPEWAEKEGIEAGVSVHFVVLSNGKVKDNIYVVRTSGYPVIDNLVMEALRNWQFTSLEGDLYGKEEWGVLTFYFSLGKELLSKG